MTPRTLVLLRHAQAEPENGLGDAQRPLSGHGRRQAAALGPVLAAEVGHLDATLVSSALRTTETYKLVASGWDGAPEADVRDELYEAGPRDVLAVLAELPDDVRRVLVVGHEPTTSALAHLLDGERSTLAEMVSLGMSTANAAVLEVPVPWAELGRSTARLVTVLRPEL
ncbi:phosphohistidine phosphatase [Georgenia satyanarayanai]|uniref:Phosphohistidine phosphatase n=1 Tax=Georgenia satyanarayanai TaxID=860221 RepID=A0A2Y9AN99_9MICO|nr:histidine phosphatase family protein [Georgenia satyanarayanai]PYF98960.1 phosphohistidine phosphatase [Georgenia satyanarayanai]SSA44808.1 phosphohistidine phosphatase [Georgenia satyanarayanai]